MKLTLEEHMKLGYLLKRIHEKLNKQIKKEKKNSTIYKIKTEEVYCLLKIKNMQDEILFRENPKISYEYMNIYYGPIEYNENKLQQKEGGE